MNKITELKNINKEKLIIELSFLLFESKTKITISLFISKPVSILELKEFILKNFEYAIEDMIIFKHNQGILVYNYKFQVKQNQKIM